MGALFCSISATRWNVAVDTSGLKLVTRVTFCESSLDQTMRGSRPLSSGDGEGLSANKGSGTAAC